MAPGVVVESVMAQLSFPDNPACGLHSYYSLAA